MRGVKLWSMVATLMVVIGLLGGAGPAAAEPPDGAGAPEVLPPGIGLMEFIHFPKGVGGRPGQVTESLCTNTTASGTANCDSYGYGGIHWANPSAIPYYVNPNFSARKSPQLTKAAAVSAIQASFNTWQAANTSGRLSYGYRGASSIKSSRLDGKNVVLWGSSSGAIAVTRVWYNTSTREIVEFDMLLGSNFAWSYTPPVVAACDGSPDYPYCDPVNTGVAGTYDVRNIGTHEAGHTLLLNDLYDASDSDLTMYGYGALGESKKDTLGYGDLLGLNAVYP